jgi:hypothetical protein
MTWKITGRIWTPSQISTALWLDADDASTITLNGSTVSQWRDKSGNARHASQLTATNQPTLTAAGLNGKPVLTFDGLNDFMNLSPVFAVGNAAANSLSVVVLFRQSAVTTTARAVFWASSGSGSTNTDYTLFSEQISGDTAPIYRFGTGAAADTVAWQRIASPTVSTNPLIFSGVMDAATSSTGTKTSFIDGAQVATGSYAIKGPAATSATIGSQPGGTAPLAGTMAEVVITNTALSTAARQRLEGYLAWKWGLVANLPANHPYKINPPLR